MVTSHLQSYQTSNVRYCIMSKVTPSLNGLTFHEAVMNFKLYMQLLFSITFKLREYDN